MEPGKPESKFVRIMMPNASESEIDEATGYWFAYLRLLDMMANEPVALDSRFTGSYVKFNNDNKPDV